MTPQTLDYLFYACLLTAPAAGVISIWGPDAWRRWAGWPLFLLALIQAGLATGILNRPPLIGGYESGMMFTLWLSALALIPCGNPQAQRRLAGWCWWTCFAFLLVFLLVIKRVLSPDWYMYQYLWTRLFFTLRLVAVSIFLYAALAALASFGARPEARTTLLRWSRNFLLVGTAVFLAGEFSGFTWRLRWMGDYWCWNANFLESTLYFLLVTAAVHLPPSWATRARLRAAALAIPGLLMIGMYMNFLLREA